jgi:hypothetical protein
MSNLPFRTKEHTPARTYTGREYADYRRYKLFLQKDFKKKCGYTNCLDDWFGGITTFQIDHFLPQSTHTKLKTKYKNLIYSCSYANRAKSNDESVYYLDPCNSDYNKHFYRNSIGEIFPFDSSQEGIYMHKKLKLYLKRYSLIWILENLENSMFDLQEIIEDKGDAEAKELFVKVGMKYNDYKRYLRAQ